jgi:hypothetical protein
MPRITLPATDIDLAADEIYAGLILNDDGTPSHHLVLLPGDNDEADWEASKAWAASINGELPTRREQSLLFANCKQHFKADWYWSGEAHASDARCAWFQTFYGGNQGDGRIYDQCRARAVRRLIIS